MIKNKTYFLRRILIVGLIISLAILSWLFIYQYKQYKEVEPRLVNAYSSSSLKSPLAYKLFSIFSEAEYFFRLYSINYNPADYKTYQSKLFTLDNAIDSLAALPIANNPIANTTSFHTGENNLSIEFADLKKQIEHLIIYSKDSVNTISDKSAPFKLLQRVSKSDSVISSIQRDTTYQNASIDTVVKKKEGLFKRIFKAKDDTLVNKNVNEVLNNNQVDIVQRNIDHLLANNEKVYNKNLDLLRNKFLKLQETEKEIILSNFALLNNLKIGIDQLSSLEEKQIRQAEEQDFAIYRSNANSFGKQLIATLIIIFLMIIFIIYYQNNVTSYERKLLKEKDYASKIADEKNSFLANISHEIRVPLTSLQGIVSLLKKDSKELNIDKEIIQSVDYDISVINNTIDDILNMSKLESESLNITYDYISPYQLTEEIINLHFYQAKNKGIELVNENKLNPNLLIYTNAFRYKQVLSNLISNALKYTKEGSVTVNTSVTKSSNSNDSLLVKVVDTGLGIDDKYKDQIFRKYYTVDKNSHRGFGLGLHISKLLAEQINGELDFESELNKGSTFFFKIPIVKQEIKSTDLSSSLKIDNLDPNIKIVFIDDSRINLFFVQQIFNNKRWIKLFEESTEAIAFLQDNYVDYVITDLVMPGMDGWEVLKSIKSNERLKHIKVIACTAESMLIETKTKDFKYVFDGILKKPIKEQDLVEIINS